MNRDNDTIIREALLKLGCTQGLATEFLEDQAVRDNVLEDLGLPKETA